MGVYIAMGAVGMPVFSRFSGGPGILLGPTGGYILGYVAIALFTGLIARRGGGSALFLAVGMAVGCAACYAFGTAWFLYLRRVPLQAALGWCVYPFIPGDIAKIAAAVVLVRRTAPILNRLTVAPAGE